MKKTCLLFLLSILSLNLLLNTALNAQVIYVSEAAFNETKAYFDNLNGPDINLLNGRQNDLLYSDNSHPYFNTERYRPGSLLLNGEAYDSVLINYDIYDQQVLLFYPDISNRYKNIVLNRELIDHFKIDGRIFRKMSFPETGTSYFQVVSEGDIACYLLWEKKLYRSSTSPTTPYKYSEQSREIYLHKEDQLIHVSNKSSFTSIFDEAYQQEIKGFLRREKIRFRNASDKTLGDLMNFCIELVNSS